MTNGTYRRLCENGRAQRFSENGRVRLRGLGRMSELRRIFESIASRNTWRNSESRSGDGSTLYYTRHLRSRLESFVRDFNIRTFFDAPCGDFNWMKEVAFPPRVTYTGGDIAASLIRDNRKDYGSPRRRFVEFD